MNDVTFSLFSNSLLPGYLQLRYRVSQRDASGNCRSTAYFEGGAIEDTPVHGIQADAIQCH